MDIAKLTDLTEKVSTKYAQKFDLKRDDDWFIFKLQEEMGELTKSYLKLSRRGLAKGSTDDQIKTNFEEELADVFGHTLLIAKHFQIDLMAVYEKKWLSYLVGDGEK